MTEYYEESEKLYRAVYPPEMAKMYWKDNGEVSSAAFYDPRGCSVDRGYHRSDDEVVEGMRKRFVGCIVTVTAGQCGEKGAIVRYKPTKKNLFHSEIHGSETVVVLDKSQRKHLARCAKVVSY